MFQTNHVWSGFHAAARCISGGLIYFTDEPGKHDLGLIDQMTAKTATSRIILRPNVGKTTQVYAGHLEPVLCKFGTYWAPEGIAGSAILGVFNVGQHPLSELFSLQAFPKIQPDQAYVIRTHTTAQISRRVKLRDAAPAVLLNLPEWGYEILTAFPLLSFPISNNSTTVGTVVAQVTEIAVLGLLHKMTGLAAVKKTEINLLDDDEAGRKLQINTTLKALGILGKIFSAPTPHSLEYFPHSHPIPRSSCLLIKTPNLSPGIYIHPPSTPPKTTIQASDNIPIPSQFINFNPETSVLEIDLEGAWEDLKGKGEDGEWKWPVDVVVELFW